MEQLLHAKVIGQGKPLIILHGFLGMLDNWKTLGKQYAQNGFEVHLLDQRNHGKSFWANDFNYALMAQDLLRYLTQKGITNINLLGHSMGGKTAMQFAINHAPMVDKLIIADIAPKAYPPHHQDIINGLLSLDFEVINTRAAADAALAKHLTNQGVRQFLLKNLYWKNKNELAFRFNLQVLQHKMEEVGQALQANATFTNHTLFLKGSKSNYITDTDLPKIKNHFTKSQIITIANAGHWLHAENPKDFYTQTINFLNP